MHKFTVERERWLHGEGSNKSYLYRESDGKMCCLGFYCESLGLSAIKGIKTPYLFPTFPMLIKDADDLMAVNDRFGVKDREEKIKEIFAKYNVEVTFI